MAEFRVQFGIDKDAFADQRDAEIARILRDAADHIERGEWQRVVKDINGNTIGDYGINTEGRA